MHQGCAAGPPVLSIAKCRDLDYYEREVVDGREDYLSEAGASPGRWAGSLAASDGLTGQADRDALAAAFSGFHPDGQRLTANPTSVAGFDLTLSASKSVSLVWALGTEHDARQVEEAMFAARDEVERYLEATACIVRRGHAGAETQPGSGFLGAVFLHRTSRLGDPGIHLHWTVFNVAEGPDGRRTALDARALYRQRYTAEAVFQATLRRELVVRLGLVFDEVDRHGVAEVAGVSAQLRRAFSRRRAEILNEMNRRGLHGGEGARIATLATRKAKPKGVSEPELRAEWRQRAGDLRFDLNNLPRVRQTPKLRADDHDLAGVVTLQHATFDRSDALRAVARSAHQGATLDQLLERTNAFLTGEHAIALGPDQWTTPEILDLERRVVALAGQPPRRELVADRAAVTAAVTERRSLTDEQRRMVEGLCQSGRPVDVVVGRAGTGKTFTLDAVRQAFEASGHRVLGASLAARAARELEAGSGISATTAHALLAGIASGRAHLRQGDLLVVDEAGMLGTRLLTGLTVEADRAQAKLVLVGDPRQLPPVEAGGLFATLARGPEVIELVQNRRQVDPEERLIGEALRRGQAELAVRCLDDHARLSVAANSDLLRDRMVIDWWGHREAGHDVVLGAVHRSDVRDLNERAHAALESEGRLGPAVAIVDDQRFCVGDEVLARRNRYDLGILNGDLGTITGAGDGCLHVRATGRDLELPLD